MLSNPFLYKQAQCHAHSWDCGNKPCKTVIGRCPEMATSNITFPAPSDLGSPVPATHLNPKPGPRGAAAHRASCCAKRNQQKQKWKTHNSCSQWPGVDLQLVHFNSFYRCLLTPITLSMLCCNPEANLSCSRSLFAKENGNQNQAVGKT